MRPSGRSVVCGIIGDPIEHSMSPSMQNAAFEATDLDWVYVAFRVAKGSAESCTHAMRALGIRGLNVTVPHKIDILPFLDSVDERALRIGAVNTVVNDNGMLHGYNTDAEGFVRALDAHGVEASHKPVVLMGAGGAARAVAYSLADRGAQLVILNRTPERAAALAMEVAEAMGAMVSHGTLDEDSLSEWLPTASLLVNTTSAGMSPNIDQSPCPEHLLHPGLTVCDIVYNPRRTLLLRHATARGATTIEGVDMLVWQGAIAFELWTGLRAPVDIMRATVEEELNRVGG
ncbi:MAG: shikimate dehydrogenase [Dehalococcoidia bacterium]|nr:shikimate dehydrogenase [Dehalococcoidia bacterium]